MRKKAESGVFVMSEKNRSTVRIGGIEYTFSAEVSEEYIERLNQELRIINEMGFNDYFLIVYDYVLLDLFVPNYLNQLVLLYVYLSYCTSIN